MVEAEGVRLTAHQRTWLERIRACEASGMTMSAYAAEHGLEARTMYGARKVLKRKGVLFGGDQPVRFQRARIVSAAIVGDGKYGGSSTTNEGDGWGAQLGGEVSRKLHLHARSLTVAHPATGAPITFTAPLPEHMARTWDFFGWRPADAPANPFEEDA